MTNSKSRNKKRKRKERKRAELIELTAEHLTERIMEASNDIEKYDLDGTVCPECGNYIQCDEACCHLCGVHFDETENQ